MTDYALLIPDPSAPGPIPGVSMWRHTMRLSKAGEIHAEMSGVDIRTNIVQCQRDVTLMTGMRNYGAGIITDLTKRGKPDETVDLQISGPDRMGELGRWVVRTSKIGTSEAAPATIAAALDTIMSYALLGWTVDRTTYPTTNSTIYLEIGGEKVLDVLIKVAAQLGENFILDGTNRRVIWLFKARPHSGLLAQRRGGGNNPNVCVIDGEPEVVESSDAVVSRIYGFGDGTGNKRRKLPATWASPDPDYALGTEGDMRFIRYLPTDTVDATRIEEQINYPDIRSSNDLAKACYEDLRKRVAPTMTLRLTLTKVERPLVPGMLITIVDRIKRIDPDFTAYEVDGDFVVLETTTEINGSPETMSLMVSTVDRFPASDDDFAVTTTRQLRSMQNHVQPVDVAAVAESNSAAIVGLTATGAVPFVGTDAQLTQDPSNFSFDNTLNRLTVHRLLIQAATAWVPVTKTVAYTMGVTETTVLANATNGAFILTLPNATGLEGRMYIIVRMNSGTNNVTVAAAAGQLIGSANTHVLTSQYQTVWVLCVGTAWVIL